MRIGIFKPQPRFFGRRRHFSAVWVGDDRFEGPGGRPRVFVWNRTLALCLGLPAAMMAFALACCQVWPVGGQSALTIDLYHMYATLIAHLHDIIYEGAGGAWSWNIGGGINYFTLFLTNVGSPLNAVIALFPKTWLPDLVGLGMVVKVGLSGLSMAWLLRFKWRSLDGWTVAFASMYALCGWMVNYYWNIMWSDLVFLLPLCLLGIELMVSHGRWGTYVAALACAMVCNYYIAALMCVFLLLYFIVTVLARFSFLREKRWILKRCLLFGAMSLLCAGVAACCLLPVADALSATSVVSDAFPKWETYHSYVDIVKATLPGATPNIRSGGVPHIYAGFLCLWLLPLYLTDRRVGLKGRLLSLLALAAMVGVMNLKPLDFIWHGMHSPNDLPFRYSFCISALLVIMAYPAARRISRKTLPGLMAWGGVILIFLVATEIWLSEEINIARMISTPVLLVGFSLVFWLCFSRGRLSYRNARLIAVSLVVVELTWGAVWGVAGTGNTDRSYYINQTRYYSQAARAARELGGDGLYRMETAKYMTLNDPALYGFKGLSHFSSMLGADLQDMMHRFGYQTYMYGTTRANRQAGQPNTPVVDSFLGVRYHLALADDKLEELSPGLRQPVLQEGNVAVLENPWALPLVFQGREAVLQEWNYTQQGPFDVQRDLISLSTGVRNVLQYLRESDLTGQDLTATRGNGHGYWYRDSDTANPGEATLTYKVTRAMPLYLYADSDQMTNIVVEVWPAEAEAGEEGAGAAALQSITHDGRYPKVIEIGAVEPGQKITVRIKLGRSRAESSFRVWVAGLDQVAFEQAFDTLKAGALQDVEYSNSHVKGTMTAEDGMALLTSIPADSGWTLYIDGRETEIIPLGKAFIGALLPAGTHEIELRWTLPGWDTGLKISLGSLLLLLLFWAVTRVEPLKPAPAAEAYVAWDPEAFDTPEGTSPDGLPGEDLTAYWLDTPDAPSPDDGDGGDEPDPGKDETDHG